ncbi:MAG: iron-containing alcohol dehydrogenase [Kiritimatiellae bacterium]|nr:iron-containing alcohol dehydrogenase [Kiritimatiellia bacterium]
MNLPVGKTCCRCFQAAFNIGARFLDWRRPVVVSGPSAVRRIPALLKRERVPRVMVVTGPTVGKKLAPKILEGLDAEGVAWTLFAEVEADPSVATADRIRGLYLETGCQGFVAIGGGSPMDAAKAAAALVVRPDLDIRRMAGLMKVGRPLPPFIAVPTTAGSGSETSIAAVITDGETHRKHPLLDLHLVPKYAVLDPEMTKDLPPAVTATTGMDALTHAVEAYLCWTYNTAESVRLAEEAVVGIFRFLERAYHDGGDMEARSGMLDAAHKAGFAFTRAGVGYVHAIAHALGGLYSTPHGLANAVILPIVLEDYGKAVEKKLARLACLTGLGNEETDAEKSRAFISEIRAKRRRMELPAGFDFIREKDIPQIVRRTLAEANPLYPVPVVYGKTRCERVIRRIRAEA